MQNTLQPHSQGFCLGTRTVYTAAGVNITHRKSAAWDLDVGCKKLEGASIIAWYPFSLQGTLSSDPKIEKSYLHILWRGH